MGAHKVLMGQVWKRNDNNVTYLVTKLYNEALSTYAVLRQIGGDEVLRVKVENKGGTPGLPGFTYTQDSRDF